MVVFSQRTARQHGRPHRSVHCAPQDVQGSKPTAHSVPFVSRQSLCYGARRGAFMKATLTFAILMVFALAAPRTATAQTSTVSGMLTNALSGDPIANTTVTLRSAGTMRQARTGPDGRFTFSEVAPGSYDLVVRSDGYLPSRTTVMVTAGARSEEHTSE